MKIILLFLLFCITGIKPVMSQSYSEFYALRSIEDSLENAGNNKRAIEAAAKMALMPTLAAFAERSLTKLNLLEKNDIEALKHLKLGISLGLDTDKLNNEPAIKDFIKKIDFKTIYQKYRKNYNSTLLCPDERLEIAQMIERDQLLRSYIGKIKSDVIYPIMRDIDSANTDELKEMIRRIGFPGIKQVGIDGEQNLFAIFLHIFLDGVNDEADMAYFEPIIRKAVLAGDFDPYYLAVIVDRYYSMKFNYQIYGAYWVPDKATKLRAITPIKEIGEVDKRRAAIYLAPLYTLKYRGYILPLDYIYKK